MRPNVLCVVLDTARADFLEPYGAPVGSTPTVAQLAATGVAGDVHAAACWTVPSHAAMFTGLPPRAAGLGRVPGGRPQGAAPVLGAQGERLLPEVLRRAGYRTGAVSANFWISESSGFAIGFERFASVGPGRQAKLAPEGLRERMRWSAEALRARLDDGAAAAEDVLAGWIDELPGDAPFFWFVNLVECHSPYLPPRPYNDLGPLDRLRAAEDASRHLTFEAILRTCAGGPPPPDDALERMRHLYGRSIRYMDDWLGRVLERLDAAGALEETSVLVTSDHGENLGEGGLIAHALSLDERLIRVPLVAAGPGADRAAEISSLTDLPRLIAALAGLETDPWGAARGGPAVAQFDPPVLAGDMRSRAAIERWGLGERSHERLTTPFECAVAGPRKLLRRGGRELLVDLERDPLELDPRPLDGAGSARDDQAAELDELRRALDAAEASGEAARTAPSPAPPPEASPEELRELEERMRLLGYL